MALSLPAAFANTNICKAGLYIGVGRNEGDTFVDTYVHVIAALAVCSRAADVWTTYLVTPTLKLEANAVARRLGWRFAFLTIVVGLVPYAWPPLGVIVLTVSFMVSASNASKIVLAKALGEEELMQLTRRVFLATPPWPGLLYLVMPAFFVGLLGGVLLFFYPRESEWGYYFGIAMLGYALAILVWYPVRYFRVRAEARKMPNNELEATRANARVSQP